MRHQLSLLASLPRASTSCSRPRIHGFVGPQLRHRAAVRLATQSRYFRITSHARFPVEKSKDKEYTSNSTPAVELNENITQEEKDHFAKKLAENKEKQIRTPWHRQGSDTPPVARNRSAGAMTKGKLLTTPSRMLKIILPLTTRDTNSDRKDLEPLALLVHPQQPISYLERLIQAELPMLTDKNGKDRVPNVIFRAEDSVQSEEQPSEPAETPVSKAAEEEDDMPDPDRDNLGDDADAYRIDGKMVKTGKINSKDNNKDNESQPESQQSSPTIQDRKTPQEASALRGGAGKGGVESYSGQGQDAPTDEVGTRKFVRWSSSTEIGDFIRDAARGQEFSIEIEGAPEEIRVGVPSFNDRTYYLRMRLRKTSRAISDMASVKKECDMLAHRAAKNVAKAGFGGIVTWWGVVYYLTFQTELGWDVMEPVTYLVGLSTLIGGYVWFLYHNREVSYRSAMNVTISRRQQKLYSERNFDLRKWENLIEDGNALRKEIKGIANEYDVEWDELKEEKDESVAEALRKERRKKRKGGKEDDGESGDEDGGEDKAKKEKK